MSPYLAPPGLPAGEVMGSILPSFGGVGGGLQHYGGFAEGVHLFPFRTEKLSPSWPMVLVLFRESR